MRSFIVLFLIALTALFTEMPPSDHASSSLIKFPNSNRLRFEIETNGKIIGYHTLTFRKFADVAQVLVDVQIDTTSFLIFPYIYRHSGVERWESGTLISLSSHTNDNGSTYDVVLEKKDDFSKSVPKYKLVDYESKKSEVEGSIFPTSYWAQGMLHMARLLDTQWGTLMNLKIKKCVKDNDFKVKDYPIQATRYEITLNDGPLINLWYDDVGNWVGMKFDVYGREVTYRLVEGSWVPSRKTAK